MHHLRPLLSLAVISLLFACDSGEKKPDAKGDKAATKDEPAKKADEDKKADEPPKPAEKHFDVSQDHSGVLARSAAAVELADEVDTETLAELSHHAEKLPSYEAVCKHMAEVRGVEQGDMIECIHNSEHHLVKLGPEVYAQAVTCLMEAKTPAEIDACIAAEVEAELLLHEKAHGDHLSQEVCDELFVHFEKLAMEDAGDHADVVKEILEETRVDIVVACLDQGKQVEVDCAMKAKILAEMKDCGSKMF